MIYIRNNNEVEKILKASQIVRDTLFMIEENIKPGVSTLELDKLAEEYICSFDATPGFKGLYGYPATLCISIDDEVVHGIPSDKILNDGSIVSVVIHVDNEESEEFVKQIYSAHTHKSFQMSTDYDAEQTQVDLTDGVLTLTTPRIVKVDQTIKLPINTKAEKSKPKLGK